jgi:hypothetical protein
MARTLTTFSLQTREHARVQARGGGQARFMGY